jgi:predicted small lipoprotein YifL
VSTSLTFRIAAALLATVALAGCGKKPGFVEPPQGRATDRFPGVYPNPTLDPQPQRQAPPATTAPAATQAQPGTP